MNAEKEEKQLQKRFLELAEKSYRQNVYTFTGFLSMAEQDILHRMEREISYAGFTLSGGSGQAERQAARFGNPESLGYEEDFPITLIKIEPLQQKFAEKLTHRDFLGALMNLGIERSLLGDIFIKDNCGFLFCLDSIADFITGELNRVKHTSVKCGRALLSEIPEKQEMVRQELTVSSERIDVVVAGFWHLSRTRSLELFQADKIYINGRLCNNNSCFLKKSDVVTVRGKGKFVYDGAVRETGKGKPVVGILYYR